MSLIAFIFSYTYMRTKKKILNSVIYIICHSHSIFNYKINFKSLKQLQLFVYVRIRPENKFNLLIEWKIHSSSFKVAFQKKKSFKAF